MDQDEAARAFREFVAVIKALRTPGTGCPWDLEQNHRTLRPFLVEETYEVLDAIDRGEDAALREELGDLLLQVVLHAQLADDRGAFSITEVVRDIAEKMVRRHPHVFGATRVSGSAEVVHNWEQAKAAERKSASHADGMERLPPGLPALQQAQRLGEKAGKAGFEWSGLDELLAKLHEELAELEAEARPDADRARLEHEVGDVLFMLCQLARRLGISAEDSLRSCNRRFIARFRRMEQQAGDLREHSHDELIAAWRHTKGST